MDGTRRIAIVAYMRQFAYDDDDDDDDGLIPLSVHLLNHGSFGSCARIVYGQRTHLI